MSWLESRIKDAYGRGASDLHLEAGTPPGLRIKGQLHLEGEALSGQQLLTEAKRLLPGALWDGLVKQRSVDLSRNLAGVRCRINIMQTSRGVGFAIRLLTGFQATLHSLNLHPSLLELTHRRHGLILVSGPTGSGKSTTIAAMLEEINRAGSQHIVTVEHPIEHVLVPKKSLIRQREVGRDTPSFEQALLDALREDPDVMAVGEMRDPSTMRLTLSAAETGHLVFSTVHSSNVVEALLRVVHAFQPEMQDSVRAQLAEVLVAVICQRLVFRPDLGIRVPECEILLANDAVKNAIRSDKMAWVRNAMGLGADDGMWTRERYARWLDQKASFVLPSQAPPLPDEPGAQAAPSPQAVPAPFSGSASGPVSAPVEGVIDLDAHAGDDLKSILSEL